MFISLVIYFNFIRFNEMNKYSYVYTIEDYLIFDNYSTIWINLMAIVIGLLASVFNLI